MDTFTKHLCKLMNQASGSLKTKSQKNFYLTAASQCPFPDQNVSKILNNVSLDAVSVVLQQSPVWVKYILEWPDTGIQLQEVGPVGMHNLKEQECQGPHGCAG